LRLKLDENLGQNAAEALLQAGHDVATVPGQRLLGAEDRPLIETCRREARCLVTLDLEFGNPLLFKPSDYPGIVVLRLPPKPAPQDLLDAIQTLIGGLAQGVDIAGKLWVVQRGRVREYQPEEEHSDG
jgi:predicted nuclease of predicted toxin-antitoxin system